MKSGRESGRRNFVTYRNNHEGFPGWDGVHLDTDPGGLAPNQFRHIENGRFTGGNWARRLGYEALNTVPVHSDTAKFRWISSVENKPLRIYIASGGCVSVDDVGFSVTWFDIDQEPRLQRGTYYAAINDISMGLFDERVYVGLSTTAPRSSEFRRYETVVVPWGKEQLDLAGPKQEYPIYTFPLRTIRWMEAFDNKLFISLDDGTTGGAADNRIAVYDGLSIFDGATAAMPADLAAMDFPASVMCRHRDFLVAGYESGANQISVREAGDVPGTWHHITPAAGTVQSYRMIPYRNKLYITPGGTGANATNIWVYDDAEPAAFAAGSLTVARNIVNSEIVCCAVLGTNFYYGWRRTTDGEVIIGKYDGTTWTDAYKILSTQTADDGSAPSLLTKIDDLIAYRGSLYAAVFSDTSVTPPVNQGDYLTYSPASDITGTWIIQNLASVANPAGLGGSHTNERQLFVSPESGAVVRRLLVA